MVDLTQLQQQSEALKETDFFNNLEILSALLEETYQVVRSARETRRSKEDIYPQGHATQASLEIIANPSQIPVRYKGEMEKRRSLDIDELEAELKRIGDLANCRTNFENYNSTEFHVDGGRQQAAYEELKEGGYLDRLRAIELAAQLVLDALEKPHTRWQYKEFVNSAVDYDKQIRVRELRAAEDAERDAQKRAAQEAQDLADVNPRSILARTAERLAARRAEKRGVAE